MVLILLNNLQFEAARFETRTMPTPDMKGKEVIYWIRVETQDKRLATDLQRFLNGSSKFIELKVPSAFISVRTELESPMPIVPSLRRQEAIEGQEQKEKTDSSSEVRAVSSGQTAPVSDVTRQEPGEFDLAGKNMEDLVNYTYVIEVILRRVLPEQPGRQSPYG